MGRSYSHVLGTFWFVTVCIFLRTAVGRKMPHLHGHFVVLRTDFEYLDTAMAFMVRLEEFLVLHLLF